MDSDLATALAAERAIVRRAVAGACDIDGGWVVRHPPLPDVWHLNRVHLTGSPGHVDGSWLEKLVARELSGVPHRRVTVDDGGAADLLWAVLEDRGWRRERALVMVRDCAGSDLPAPAGASGVGGVDEAQLRAFQLRAFADDARVSAGAGELPARIAETQAILRAGTQWRSFGAGASAGGRPVSTATLYLDPEIGGRRVAFVDQVATLRALSAEGPERPPDGPDPAVGSIVRCPASPPPPPHPPALRGHRGCPARFRSGPTPRSCAAACGTSPTSS
ncbi:MAG TPA: hypothetical protein VGL69_06260 [Solirubrobacteraceae bacterium]